MIGSPASRGAAASLGGAGRACLAAASAVSAASAAIVATVKAAKGPKRRIAANCAVVNRFVMLVEVPVRACVDRMSNRDFWDSEPPPTIYAANCVRGLARFRGGSLI